MVYAQIKDGIIKNTIVLDDMSLLNVFLDGFDYLLRVDDLDPQPSIGWSYDGSNYAPPPEIEDEGEE